MPGLVQISWLSPPCFFFVGGVERRRSGINLPRAPPPKPIVTSHGTALRLHVVRNRSARSVLRWRAPVGVEIATISRTTSSAAGKGRQGVGLALVGGAGCMAVDPAPPLPGVPQYSFALGFASSVPQPGFVRGRGRWAVAQCL
jgi:hypothetical protein